MTILTDLTFEPLVVGSKKPFLVMFSSTKCGPCKVVEPILEKIESKNPKLQVGKIDVAKYPKLATKYSLGSLPTILLFSRGIINQYVGKPTEEALARFIATHG